MMQVLSSSEDVGSRYSIRDAVFSLKLLALIDGLFSGLVDIFAGTGRTSQHHNHSTPNYNNNRMNDLAYDCIHLTITSSNGWVFAFEGGAHILFRHTTKDRRFVCPLQTQSLILLYRKESY
jgi:hypothetical protein